MLSDAWRINVNTPLQIRALSINYEKMDGSSYEPPYAGLHHRNELLIGLGDIELRADHVAWINSWGLISTVGTTLPTGKIEENPYLRAQESQSHQHIQMGTGTFVPTVAFTLFYDNIQWGLQHNIQQTLPFYENNKNYKQGMSTTWGIGIWKRFTQKMLLMGQFRGIHEAPDTWLNLPYAGRDTLALNASVMWSFSKNLEANLQLERNLWNKARLDEEDPLSPPFMFTVGLTHFSR